MKFENKDYEELKKLLGGLGYHFYGKHSLHDEREELFQKRIYIEEADPDNCKRFVEIWRWDMSDLFQTRDHLKDQNPISYEIGATFEAQGLGWVSIKFYQLRESELLKNLTEYETKIGEMFSLLKGRLQ